MKKKIYLSLMILSMIFIAGCRQPLANNAKLNTDQQVKQNKDNKSNAVTQDVKSNKNYLTINNFKSLALESSNWEAYGFKTELLNDGTYYSTSGKDKKTGKLDKSQLNEIIKIINEFNFFNFKDQYTLPFTGRSSAGYSSITIKTGKTEKTVSVTSTQNGTDKTPEEYNNMRNKIFKILK